MAAIVEERQFWIENTPLPFPWSYGNLEIIEEKESTERHVSTWILFFKKNKKQKQKGSIKILNAMNADVLASLTFIVIAISISLRIVPIL